MSAVVRILVVITSFSRQSLCHTPRAPGHPTPVGLYIVYCRASGALTSISRYWTGVERGAPFSPIKNTRILAGSVVLAFLALWTTLAGL